MFNWLKKNGIPENEMLKTFNCGVGFCLIINKKNLKKDRNSKEKPFNEGRNPLNWSATHPLKKP